ncbi:ribonuclease Z [Robiginitalea sp. IMCC43444]|uniref:ribonuclease Z n=1 Tax=Robiginitalea sp. IMCC43444 TaxID=3459121 RepID=UPI0040427C1B
MKLQILGCHAATPKVQAAPTAQVLEAGNQLMLLDCGEGTQMQLRRYKVKFSRINRIFISHLHGDHFFGLPGLVATFRLMGRETPLHIYGPKGLKEAITLFLKLGDSWTQYPLHFHELTSEEPECIYEDSGISISTLPLKHRIYTNGFLITEKSGMRGLKAEQAEKYGIDKAYFRKIKQGADAISETGKVIPNEELTTPPKLPKTYAYCTDTAYDPELAPRIKGVDRLYHEATFLQTEEHLAMKTGHSTAAEAARLAAAAGVESLILGHYSSRYKDLSRFREEALAFFPRVELAEDGKIFSW